MRIVVASYSEAKKILGTPMQCIGVQNGYLAYVNPNNVFSPTVIIVKEKAYSKKRRQK